MPNYAVKNKAFAHSHEILRVSLRFISLEFPASRDFLLPNSITGSEELPQRILADTSVCPCLHNRILSPFISSKRKKS